MQDLFRHLSTTSRVLDLGCAAGSFDRYACPAPVVRVDLDAPPLPVDDHFVRSDAAALPFPDGCFDLVVSNHSLEHFESLPAALAEIRRVLAPGGVLYVAVPDASTVTDRLYRWLARGGGHVNAFTSLEQLVATVERGTAMRLRSARVLCTSLSFLNRRNHPGRPPRKLWLLGGGNETVLRWLTWWMRLSDRWLRTRASVYGWRCTFEAAAPLQPPSCEPPWTNVCVRCGSGHPAEMLEQRGLVRGRIIRFFACPACRAGNIYTDDRDFSRLR